MQAGIGARLFGGQGAAGGDPHPTMKDSKRPIEKKLDRIATEMRLLRWSALICFFTYYLSVDRGLVLLVIGAGAAGFVVFELGRSIIAAANKSRAGRERRELAQLLRATGRMNPDRTEPPH